MFGLKPEDELVLRKMAEENFNDYARKLCKDAGFSRSEFRGSTIYCYDYRGDYHELGSFLVWFDRAEVNEYDGEHEFEAMGEARFHVRPSDYLDDEKVESVSMSCHLNRTVTDPNKVAMVCFADVVPGPKATAEEICDRFNDVDRLREYPDTRISCRVSEDGRVARVVISEVEDKGLADLDDFEEFAWFIIGDQFYDERKAMAEMTKEVEEDLKKFRRHSEVMHSFTVEPVYCETEHETGYHGYDCSGTAWLRYESKDPVKLYDEVVEDFKVPES